MTACKMNTAYHLIQEAAAFYLENISIIILQDIKPVDGLNRVWVWVSLAGKVREVMLAHQHLSSLPAQHVQHIVTDCVLTLITIWMPKPNVVRRVKHYLLHRGKSQQPGYTGTACYASYIWHA